MNKKTLPATKVGPQLTSHILLEGTCDLPVDLILLDPHQPRKHFNDAYIERLGNSIVAVGQQQPIVVCPATDKPGYYYINFGENRYLAIKLKKIALIRCDIDKKNSYDGKLNPDRVLRQAIENVCREPHTISELVGVMSLLLTEEKAIKEWGAVDRAIKRFADALGEGRSSKWASNYRTLVDLHPDLLRMLDVKNSGLTFVAALVLATNEMSVQKTILSQAQERNKTGSMSELHSLISKGSREQKKANGLPVRGGAEILRRAYFSYFNKIAGASRTLTTGVGSSELSKYERKYLDTTSPEGIAEMLAQARSAMGFLQLRIKSLESKSGKKAK